MNATLNHQKPSGYVFLHAKYKPFPSFRQDKMDRRNFPSPIYTINHERFLKLSAGYEAEQKELTELVKTKKATGDTYEQDRMDLDRFAAVIRKYVGIWELTPTIVNEFIKQIIVHARINPADTADRRYSLS